MVNAADDEEFIQINDFWTYNAFNYWSAYGLTAETSHQYNDTYSTTGTFSQSATFTMSESSTGSESGSISGSFQLEYQESSVPYSVWIPKSVDLSLTPDSGQTGAMSYPNFACVYNPSATGASATMTCTPSGNSVFTQDDYTLEINTIGDAGDGTGGLFCYIKPSAQPAGVGTITALSDAPFHANFSLYETSTGSGSFTGSGSITMTTTTVNTNSLKYVLPTMTGTPNNEYHTQYSKVLRNNEDDPSTIIWLQLQEWNKDIDKYFTVYPSNGSYNTPVSNKQLTNIVNKYIGGAELFAFSVYSSDSVAHKGIHLKWNFGGSISLIPLYVGPYKSIPDDLYRFVYGGDRNIDAINAQTAADQQHHDEMMDTSESSKIQTDGDALVADADEKFGDLFFPLNHAIETANDLANVNATGIIRLPAIFSDNEYWYLDLTQIEQKLPDAWHFIQALCQLAVAIYMIHGLYNLFFGGSNDS